MSVRGFLFDNLGLKLVALLLAVIVYLNVYTERDAHLTLSFPLELTGLADSLAVSGDIPDAVHADLAGSGKHLLRLRFMGSKVEVSLKDALPGRFVRRLGPDDLPLPQQAGVRVERFGGPSQVEFEVERRIERRLPVRVTVGGHPGRGQAWSGTFTAQPESVTVSGPRNGVLRMQSVDFGTVEVQGRRDTVAAEQEVAALPRSYRVSPDHVRVHVPLEPTETRPLRVPVRAREGTSFRVEPDTVSIELSAPSSFWQRADLSALVGRVAAADTAQDGLARVALDAQWRDAEIVRMDPESVLVRREPGARAPHKTQGPIR